MESLPFYIPLVFVLTTWLTIYFFYRSCPVSRIAVLILLSWTILQGVIGWSGFYKEVDSIPPRFILLLFPALLSIGILFFTSGGKVFIDGLDVKALTLLHVIRLPVELVLHWLFMNRGVPQIMTFEGFNFDIFSGISAPFVYYFGLVKNNLNKTTVLVWNFICLGLLINIVVLAVLSAPSPFQRLAFDQPNVAVLYFPYTWLPGVIVPLVLFSHLVVIRRLMVHAGRDRIPQTV